MQSKRLLFRRLTCNKMLSSNWKGSTRPHTHHFKLAKAASLPSSFSSSSSSSSTSLSLDHEQLEFVEAELHINVTQTIDGLFLCKRDAERLGLEICEEQAETAYGTVKRFRPVLITTLHRFSTSLTHLVTCVYSLPLAFEGHESYGG